MIRSHLCYLLFRTAFHVDIIGFRHSLLPFTQLRLVLQIQYGHSPVTSRGYPPQVHSIVFWLTVSPRHWQELRILRPGPATPLLYFRVFFFSSVASIFISQLARRVYPALAHVTNQKAKSLAVNYYGVLLVCVYSSRVGMRTPPLTSSAGYRTR